MTPIWGSSFLQLVFFCQVEQSWRGGWLLTNQIVELRGNERSTCGKRIPKKRCRPLQGTRGGWFWQLEKEVRLEMFRLGGRHFLRRKPEGKEGKREEIFSGFFFLLFEKGRTRVRGTGFTEKYGGSLRKKGARGKKKVSVGVVHGFSREFLEPKWWETHHKFVGEKHFSNTFIVYFPSTSTGMFFFSFFYWF